MEWRILAWITSVNGGDFALGPNGWFAWVLVTQCKMIPIYMSCEHEHENTSQSVGVTQIVQEITQTMQEITQKVQEIIQIV